MMKIILQYKEFCIHTDEQEPSIRFLKGAYNARSVTKLKKTCSDQTKKDANIEKLYWAPLDAFKCAHDFKIKYDGKLTDELIESLLFEVCIKANHENINKWINSLIRYGKINKIRLFRN